MLRMVPLPRLRHGRIGSPDCPAFISSSLAVPSRVVQGRSGSSLSQTPSVCGDPETDEALSRITLAGLRRARRLWLDLASVAGIQGRGRRKSGLGAARRHPGDALRRLHPLRPDRVFGACLVRQDRPQPSRHPAYLPALRVPLLVHDLRAVAYDRLLGVFRRDGAIPRLFDQGADRRAGRRPGRHLFDDVRPRRVAGRRFRFWSPSRRNCAALPECCRTCSPISFWRG